jgi:hypothetical protein
LDEGSDCYIGALQGRTELANDAAGLQVATLKRNVEAKVSTELPFGSFSGTIRLGMTK